MKRPVTSSSEIPDKVYFRIGEVSNLIGVDSHVLRYWESEFKELKPQRTKSNQRLYRRQDVETLLRIRELLHEQGYKIAGARRFLLEKEVEKSGSLSGESDRVMGSGKIPGRLQEIKDELKSIHRMLIDHQADFK